MFKSVDVPRVIVRVWLPDSFRIEAPCAAIAWDAELGEREATFAGIRAMIAHETGWDAASIVMTTIGSRLRDVLTNKHTIATGGTIDLFAYEADKIIRLVAPHGTARSPGITLVSTIGDLLHRIRTEYNIAGAQQHATIELYNNTTLLQENTTIGDIVFTQLLTEVHNHCAIRINPS